MATIGPAPADQASPERQRAGLPVGVGVAIAIGMLLVIGSAIALFVGNDMEKTPNREAETPTRGVACTHLESAGRLQQEGDQERLWRAVLAAAVVAERALDVSGQAFGAAEEAALNLRSVLETQGPQAPAFDRWLRRGLQACAELGRAVGEPVLQMQSVTS